MNKHDRPDPDGILKRLQVAEDRMKIGRLRVFLGMSAGVGKTYSMLRAAHARAKEGKDVVVGIVESHGRLETLALTESLEILPRTVHEYKGVMLEEMDLDAILRRRPQIVLVDELAHTNVPGSRHSKRYQDVIELLDLGIDVYTTINIQHLESRKDLVEKITGVPIRETVPDSILERAEQIEVIDIAPNELLQRLKDGKIYLGDKAERAAENFFKADSLTALREIALRFTAEKVDHELQEFHSAKSGVGPWQTNERLMVAVSHSPYSERLIRATRRLAYNLEAPWVVVHVDNGISLNIEDQNQLSKNLNLARELKAEIVTTTDTDISHALKRVARQKNVTQIVVGRPAKRYIKDLIEGGTLLDRLVRESWEVDVHVIRQDSYPRNFSSWLPKLNFTSGFISYWNTLWFFIGVGFLSGIIESWIGYRTVGFLFLLGVLIIGRFAALGPVIFAAALSAISWNYFFIPPRFTLAVSSAEDWIVLITYFVVAIITGTLTSRVRQHEGLLRDREERTNVLYEVLKDISTSSGSAEFLARVTSRIGHVLSGDCGVILKNEDATLGTPNVVGAFYSINDNETAVAQWSFANQRAAGWSTDTLSETKKLFIPLYGDTETVGVFIYNPKPVRNDRKLSLEEDNLLHSVCRQLGLSLERSFSYKRLQAAERLHESEKLHQTLLNSISHEMRTPLTAILGSASVLGDDASPKTDDFRKMIASDLTSAGERLNRVIENLLDMSRLNAGALAIKKEWHDPHDLIGVTLNRLGHALNKHSIRVDFPANLPLVEIDYRLMEHAISNLVFNAIAYTPAGTEIKITAKTVESSLLFVIEDAGSGIPLDSVPKLFEKFYRVPGTPTGGTGLGLSIVKSIVEFHNGDIRVENRAEGGARFVLSLPLGKPPVGPEEII